MPNFLVLAGDNWHRGVVGIFASKICAAFGKPAVILSREEDGTLFGSGRSVGNFPLLEPLTGAQDLLATFGGHAQACGLTLTDENLAAFSERVATFAAAFFASGFVDTKSQPDLVIRDCDVTLKLAEEIKLLEPFGTGNPEPIFKSGFEMNIEPVVLKDKHLKFNFVTEMGRLVGLWWNLVELTETIDWDDIYCLDALYKIQTNNWKGKTSVQICLHGAVEFNTGD